MSRHISQKEAKEFDGLMHVILRELTAGSKDPAGRVCRWRRCAYARRFATDRKQFRRSVAS